MKKVLVVLFFMMFVLATEVVAQNCGEVLTASTILNSDIGPCSSNGLVIGSDDIVLDCNGHSIIGNNPSTTTSGILLNGRSGVEIKNCNILNFRRGVSIIKGSENNVNNNIIQNNNQYGIYISNSTNNTITSNSILSNRNSGLYMYRSNYNLIAHNSIITQDFGISLNSANYNKIDSNNISENNYAGISVGTSSNSNDMINNNISNNRDGIVINKAVQNEIISNMLDDNLNSGIFILNNANMTEIKNNIITLNKIGINSDRLYQSRLLISNNNIQLNTEKNVNIVDGSVVMVNNIISHAPLGVRLEKVTGYDAPNNFVQNNICWHDIGLEFVQTDINIYQPDYLARNNWCGNSNGIIAEAKWDVMARVVNKNGLPVKEANVDIFQYEETVPIFNLFTGETGLTEKVLLTEYIIDAEGNIIPKTPHIFRVTKNNLRVDHSETITSNRLPPNEVVIILQSHLITLPAVDDAYVNQQYPNNNYGFQTSLQTKPTTNGIKRSFLKFDLANLQNKTILSAKLKVCRDVTANSVTDVAAYSVLNDEWTENTITWNNQPTFDILQDITNIVGGSGCVYYSWDVTPFIISEIQMGERYASLMLKDFNEGTGNFNVIYRSEEYSGTSYDPVLIIEYSEMPVNTTPDTTPPLIQLLLPANNAVMNANPVEFRYIATDDRAPELTCTFYSNKSGTFLPVQTHTNVPNGAMDLFYIDFNNGNWQWNVKCSDGVNEAFAPSNFAFTQNLPPLSGIFNYTPIADAVIDQKNPNTNYGTKSYLATKPDAGAKQRSFLKFDLTNLTSYTVTQATLYICRDTSPAGDRTIGLYSVLDDAWQENSVVWNNQPALTTLLGTTIIAGGSGCKWYSYDITAFVKDKVKNNNGIISLGLKDEDEENPGLLTYFRSKEYIGTTYDPKLEVSYSS